MHTIEKTLLLNKPFLRLYTPAKMGFIRQTIIHAIKDYKRNQSSFKDLKPPLASPLFTTVCYFSTLLTDIQCVAESADTFYILLTLKVIPHMTT